ncbi:hypothetical protein BKA70DRAFT_1356865 [Coprinopsis sp. MPI-PUGE-AT-0042]|nr:hypothetical protein BKA70DRAFT_1356865 [Coprinopsis sp. MPI-PUGE-AT-0042]
MPSYRQCASSNRRAREQVMSVRRSPRQLAAKESDPYAGRVLFQRKIQEDTPLQRMFLCEDLAQPYLARLDWPTLMAVGIFSRPSTMLVQEEVRRRIRHLLDPFLTTLEFNPFMSALGKSKGLLVGPIARILLQQNSAAEIASRQLKGAKSPYKLHVLVPRGEAPAFMEALRQFKYAVTEDKGEHERIRSVPAVESTVFVAIAKSDTQVKSTIVVHECERRPLETLLNGRLTSDMNAIGEQRIYSVFPQAVYRNEGIHSDAHRFFHGASRKPGVLDGVSVMPSNQHMPSPCGLECPGVERVIPKDKGVGMFHWGREERLAYATREEDEVLQADYLVLRFLSRCHNVHCEHWTPGSTSRR